MMANVGVKARLNVGICWYQSPFATWYFLVFINAFKLANTSLKRLLNSFLYIDLSTLNNSTKAPKYAIQDETKHDNETRHDETTRQRKRDTRQRKKGYKKGYKKRVQKDSKRDTKGSNKNGYKIT